MDMLVVIGCVIPCIDGHAVSDIVRLVRNWCQVVGVVGFAGDFIFPMKQVRFLLSLVWPGALVIFDVIMDICGICSGRFVVSGVFSLSGRSHVGAVVSCCPLCG